MKHWLPFALLGMVCVAGASLFEGSLAKGCSVYAGANFLCLSLACLSRWPGLWLKRANGKINPVSYLLFAPLHLLHRISFLLAIGWIKESPAHQIADNLWLGRRLDAREAEALLGQSPIAVLDMTSEFPERLRLTDSRYLCLPVVDHSAPTQQQLWRALDFIAANIGERKVFIHCALGHGRGATVAAAWLLEKEPGLSVDAAVERIRAIRPWVRLSADQIAELETFVRERSKPK
jgi:protein-tyrosine phosphatase